MRRATLGAGESCNVRRDFYPRSPCGERQPILGKINTRGSKFLSTLSLRRATTSVVSSAGTTGFLSTLSLRRATFWKLRNPIRPGNFYPRSPCGERHLRVVDGSKSSIISIHALLAESDGNIINSNCNLMHFYPRSPCGERRANQGT